MRKLRLLIMALGAAMLVVAFQNCGSKVNFSSDLSESLSKDLGDGELVLIEEEESNQEEVANSEEEPEEEPKSEEESSSDEEDKGEEEIVNEEIQEEVIDENQEEQVVDESPSENLLEIEQIVEDGPEFSSESGKYICILEGPGKSVRLGFDSEQLVAVGQTPQVVCTTQRACEEIVSQAFEVKTVAKRGFCGKNPHTHSLSEADIAELLGLI